MGGQRCAAFTVSGLLPVKRETKAHRKESGIHDPASEFTYRKKETRQKSVRPDGYTPRMWKGREAAVRRQIMLSLSYGNSGARMLLVRGRELNYRTNGAQG